MIYVEAYGAEDHQILGNLDGQAAMHRSVRDYTRTSLYRALTSGVGRPRWPRVKEWRVVVSVGADHYRTLEVIPNRFHETPVHA